MLLNAHGLFEPLRQSLENAFIRSMEKDGDPMRDTAFTNMERVIDYLEGRSVTI